MDWLLLWSLAVYDYGLTTEQFKRMTLTQFYALSKRCDVETKGRDRGFGLVTSAIYNVNRDMKKQKDPYKAEDFMPKYEKANKKREKKDGAELFRIWNTEVVPKINKKARKGKKKYGRK